MKRSSLLLLGVLLCTALCADDWPQWRGAQRDGVWREDGILDAFPAGGLPVRWRTPIGAGYSGPAVSGGKVFIMDRTTKPDPETDVKLRWDFRDKSMGLERVLCLDEATGKIVWTHSYLCKYSAAYGTGPRVTPTVCGEKLYTLGTMGDLYCLEAATGKELWKKNLTQDYGSAAPLYGFAIQPLVEGDMVIVLAGGAGPAVIAFDRHTGKEIWKALKTSEPGYSAPLVRTLAGQRQLIVWHADALAGLEPETGKVLWTVPHAVKVGMAITTPAIEGNRLAVCSQYEGVLMLEFKPGVAEPQVLWKASTGGAPEKTWKPSGFNTTLSTILLLDNCVYGSSLYGEFCCLNGDTGQRLWTTLAPTSGGTEPKDRWSTVFMVPHAVGPASVPAGRDAGTTRVFIFNEKGDLILSKLSAKGYEEISRAHILDPDMFSSGTGGRKVIWSHPAFANRCVYARNNQELICVSLAKP
ncbi:MAG TPA: PQQ-binding-like beta-propeller repeat protein [Planctomycetota bacterium]|jgi:outer membrane protein assembly factor BamB